MYRSGKPFHASARLFLYLVIHVLSTTFLSTVEGAQTSASQRSIAEAQKTVGRFLRNGVGTTWLSDLAKTRSTPLTTEDIVNELLRTTKPNGRVWRAASVLSEALKLKTLEGLRPESIIGQSDNWKDIIAGVEKEDDIICLYRKNTEETAKKSEDWQKFLKTVSPGYTVHLAIDTGIKYVICLKRLDVPEATSTELSSSSETTMSSGSTASVTEATSSTLRPTTIAPKPAVIPTSAMKTRSTSERSDFKFEGGAKCCNETTLEENEDNERKMKEAEEDIDNEDLKDAEEDVDNENSKDAEEEIDNEDLKDDEENYSLDNSFEDEHMEETEEMKDDLSGESEDYRGSSENARPGPIAPPTGLRRLNSMNSARRSYVSVPALGGPGGFIPESSKRDRQCGRPIILVVQPGNFPMGTFPAPPLRLPVPPGLTSIPRTHAKVPGWPRRPFNTLGFANNYPWSMRSNNLGKPTQGFPTFMHERLPLQNFSRKTNFGYNLPSEEKRLVKSVEKPIFQKNRNTFAPKVLHRESWGSRVVHRSPSIMPRRVERLPVSNIRNKALPIGRPSGLPQWPQKAKNIVIPRARIPDRSDLVRYNFLWRLEQERKKYLLHQFMINRLNSQSAPRVPIYKPIFNPALSTPPSIVQFPRPWILTGSPVQKRLKVNRGLPVQTIDRTNLQPINFLYHPPANNFIDTRQSQSMTNAFSPVIERSPIFEGIRGNVPCVKEPVDQLQRYSAACPNPCDRPIRLQIVIQEPAKVSVLTEPGERVEIVGSGKPVMPHGSRSGKAEEKIEPEVAEVERRMENDSREETEKDKENEAEAFAIDDTSESEESESEEHSTTISGNQITSDKLEEGNSGQKIGERFLDETTPSLESNSTISAITNSTLIV